MSSPKNEIRKATCSYAGKIFEGVAAHAEGATHEVDIVALILDIDQVAEYLVAPYDLAAFQRDHRLAVLLRRTDTVDAGDRRNDDRVAPREERACCGMAQAVDLFVDLRFFLDIGIGARRDRPPADNNRSRKTKYSTALWGKNSLNSE